MNDVNIYNSGMGIKEIRKENFASIWAQFASKRHRELLVSSTA
jgi:hypothetical protein